MELAPGYKAEGRSKGAWGGAEYPASRADDVADERTTLGSSRSGRSASGPSTEERVCEGTPGA